MGGLTSLGCFSIARYEANVRPDTIRSSTSIKGKYRLAQVYLHKYGVVRLGLFSEADCRELDRLGGSFWFNDDGAKWRNSKWTGHSPHFANWINDYNTKYYNSEPIDFAQPNLALLMTELEQPQVFTNFLHSFTRHHPYFRFNNYKRLMEYNEAETFGDRELKMECITNAVLSYCMAKNVDITKQDFSQHVWQQIKEIDGNSDCRKMYFDAIQKALLKNYPDVFTTSIDATPVTVLLTWENRVEDPHNYGGIFCALGSPSVQDMETTYRIYVALNSTGSSEYELWNQYLTSMVTNQYGGKNGMAVRQRETWTSFFLPISWIGIAGQSDWSTKRKIFACWPETEYSTSEGIVSFKSLKYIYTNPQKYMEKFVFDPVSDGDVIAALIMHSLNKINAIDIE